MDPSEAGDSKSSELADGYSKKLVDPHAPISSKTKLKKRRRGKKQAAEQDRPELTIVHEAAFEETQQEIVDDAGLLPPGAAQGQGQFDFDLEAPSVSPPDKPVAERELDFAEETKRLHPDPAVAAHVVAETERRTRQIVLRVLKPAHKSLPQKKYLAALDLEAEAELHAKITERQQMHDDKLQKAFLKDAFGKKGKAPTAGKEIERYVRKHQDELKVFAKYYEKKLKAKVKRCKDERGLSSSESMSDLSDLDSGEDEAYAKKKANLQSLGMNERAIVNMLGPGKAPKEYETKEEKMTRKAQAALEKLKAAIAAAEKSGLISTDKFMKSKPKSRYR